MRIKIVKQQDESDCGVACIATVSQFYGKKVSINRIRSIAGTDTKGTSGKGIVKAANYIGFDCKGIYSKEKKLVKDIPLPIIVHIIQNQIEHYVVVYRNRRGKVWIADPASNHYSLDWEKFKEIWTGVFFILVPNELFAKTSDHKNIFQRFLFILKENKKILFEVILSSIILTVLGIVSAFYFRYLIDEVIFSGLPQALTTVSVGFLFVIIFQVILSFSRNYIIIHLGNKIEAVLVMQYFSHVLKLPIDFFISRKSGEIISRINDASTIRNALSNMTVSIILDTLMLFIGGMVLFSLSSKLIAIGIIPVILSGLLVLIFSKPFKKLIQTRASIEAEKYSYFYESINGISTIKALSTEKDAFEKAEIKILKSISSNFKLNTFGNIQSSIQSFLSQFGNLAIYWYGSILIMRGDLSLGELITFVTLLGYFLGPLSRLITLQPQLQEISVSSDRLGQILDLPDESQDDFKYCDYEYSGGGISITNLVFSYGTRGPALSGINMNISPGEKIAFVGPSGSGKTTLVKLLMKFYKPDTGEILIDNMNILDISTEKYRSLFGYVPQEILLFSGTIAENIAWGTDDISINNILKASKDAQAHTFISKLDNRYFTYVGEKGASLSGGERQRIALARVLLRNPRFIILDEATSSLDSISEAAIMKTINSIKQENTTLIIIAHRLSTIKNCDKIFVFDQGKIVESGNHDYLCKLNGKYMEMWQSQFYEG